MPTHGTRQLSILIPIFNYNVLPLASELIKQAKEVGGLAWQDQLEIIFIDDASTEEIVKKNNAVLQQYEEIIFQELPKNLGRAAARIFLAQQAKFPNLLFLDCDMMPRSGWLKFFFQINPWPTAVTGGIAYKEEKPAIDRELDWIFGKKREEIPLSLRKKHPWKAFSLGNTIVWKEYFLLHPPKQAKAIYGHEDTQFAIELLENGEEILPIQNPILITEHETNEEFMEKQRLALDALLEMANNNPSVRKITAYKYAKKARTFLPFLPKGLWDEIATYSYDKTLKVKQIRWLDIYKLSFLASRM